MNSDDRIPPIIPPKEADLDHYEREIRRQLDLLQQEFNERARPLLQSLAYISSIRLPSKTITLPQVGHPDPLAHVFDPSREAAMGAAMLTKIGSCPNYPRCGCKVQHGYDCIPF